MGDGIGLGSVCFDFYGSAAHCSWICCLWLPNDHRWQPVTEPEPMSSLIKWLNTQLSPCHPSHKVMKNQWNAPSISREILGSPLIKSRAAAVELQIGLERLKLNEQSLDFPPLKSLWNNELGRVSNNHLYLHISARDSDKIQRFCIKGLKLLTQNIWQW